MKVFFCYILLILLRFSYCSLKTCPWQTPLSIKINSNDTATQKQNCINDETCCFVQVRYKDSVGGFKGTTCIPIDYDKNTSNYTYASWQSLSLTFCQDAKILALNWTNIDYINDCECGYKLDSFMIRLKLYDFLLISSVFFVYLFMS